MSVPAEQIQAGRYYRTSIGGRPTVVKALTGALPYTGYVVCVEYRNGAPRGATKYMKAARLFNEVVAAGDGSGRWTQVDWRTR